MRSFIAGIIIALAAAAPTVAATLGQAIIILDQTALRAAPRDSAQQQAVLWQGEAVEVRGERMDYLQIYDYKRERGGFVRASQVRRLALTLAEAPDLLALGRFMRDTPGSEALGIGIIAAFVQAAPVDVINSAAGIEALDALGTFAERLARRASSNVTRTKPAQMALAAHLEVAARYGITFTSYERAGRMQLCYEGNAFRRVLAMQATAEQRARAALALTRPECIDPVLRPLERNRMDEWRAEVLERVDVAGLPPYLKNRVAMRRAGVWSALAYERTRIALAGDADPARGPTSQAAAQRTIAELSAVIKAELTDDDAHTYTDAAMRVNAARWAALPAVAPALKNVTIDSLPGESGETCMLLTDAKHDVNHPLAKRCTYGIVWLNSTALNREGTALTVAVQQTDTWRELWVFRREPDGWTVSVLPPATTSPDVGYAEFAGWVPGGRQMLVAREAKGDGKYKRSFEVVRLATLTPEWQSADPANLSAFQRWQDPSWKRLTMSLR